MMKLYRILQTERTGWDTFDSAVVVAPNRKAAAKIHPGGYKWDNGPYRSWCASPESVTVEYLGQAAKGLENKPCVICASFNAG